MQSMNAGAAGASEKSHAGDDSGIAPLKKEAWGTRYPGTTVDCYVRKFELLLDTPVTDRDGSAKLTTWLREREWLPAALVRNSKSSALPLDTTIP